MKKILFILPFVISSAAHATACSPPYDGYSCTDKNFTVSGFYGLQPIDIDVSGTHFIRFDQGELSSAGYGSCVANDAVDSECVLAVTSAVTKSLNTRLTTAESALGATRSESSPTRTISTTAFQISSTRDAMATYNINTSTTASIGGAAAVTIVAEISPTSGGTYVEKGRAANSQTISLAVVLQSVQATTTPITIFVPAGYYVKLRQLSASGTSSASVASTQETLF